MSFSDLQKETGLSDDELKRQLASLTMSEHQVLAKQGNLAEENKMSDASQVSKNRTVKKNITAADIF